MGSVYADLGASSKVVTTGSNLVSFLGSITPIVGTHTDAKKSSSTENAGKKVSCYNLEDLWNQFYQSSACGVGTPVRFPCGEKIDQYFIPYLSAIQLYTIADNACQRNLSCDGDLNVEGGNISDEYSNNKSCVNAKGDDQKTSPTSKNGHLCFQYFELASRDDRIPLVDKVYELSHNFPVLASLNSADLTPSSWMSIFWYPICHVPDLNLEPLSTCFLTYHGLATSEDHVPQDIKDAFHRYVVLTPFGMSTHKMDSRWMSADSKDEELATSLFNKAQSWLEKNDIKHHDFDNLSDIMKMPSDKEYSMISVGSSQAEVVSLNFLLSYPIFHVPDLNLENPATCFWTYHGLATSEDHAPVDTEDAFHCYATLPPFGLSTHKMDSRWMSANSKDQSSEAGEE